MYRFLICTSVHLSYLHICPAVLSSHLSRCLNFLSSCLTYASVQLSYLKICLAILYKQLPRDLILSSFQLSYMGISPAVLSVHLSSCIIWIFVQLYYLYIICLAILSTHLPCCLICTSVQLYYRHIYPAVLSIHLQCINKSVQLSMQYLSRLSPAIHKYIDDPTPVHLQLCNSWTAVFNIEVFLSVFIYSLSAHLSIYTFDKLFNWLSSFLFICYFHVYRPLCLSYKIVSLYLVIKNLNKS